ncbi:hypothetical protein ACFFQF_14030 [Haladaptatus pallidirubidus]|uniref:PH domain-containing protein n=1 Tax=Haladaptatus pallidirubidus TaxID=1008152 RepID=A0AAV3UDA3_9EURY|nr:hypothetical protein [Haladaptatus pallidirubidus]
MIKNLYYGLLGPLWAASIAGILAVGRELWWMARMMAVTTVLLAAAFVPVKTAEYVAEYGHMTYRVYDDEIVGYEEWLNEVQWRLGFGDVAEVSTRQRRIDRRLGTRTIELAGKSRLDKNGRGEGNRVVRLANLPDGHLLRRELERRIR